MNTIHAKIRRVLMIGAWIALSTFCLAGTAAAEPLASGRVLWVEDGAERGLGGVLVSDGFTFTETDEHGQYALPLHGRARWITFVNPKGTMPTTELYHRLAALDGRLTDLDFRVSPLPRALDEPFRFVHHSDLHLSHERHAETLFERIGSQLERMPVLPDFALDSGDIAVNFREHIEWARALFDRYPVPVFVAKGNHDIANRGPDETHESFRGEVFEEQIAPAYYAFTYGQYLFVNVPWYVFNQHAMNWMESLLDQIGRDYHVVANVHHWHFGGMRGNEEAFIRLLQTHNARGVFWGHYHVTQVHTFKGIPSFGITAGRVWRNRDLSRPAFNVITAYPDGRMVADHRETGFEHHVELCLPAEQTVIRRGRSIPVLVNAYDTARPVDAVTVHVRDAAAGRVLAEVALEHGGGWAWTARMDVGRDWPDEILIGVRVRDAGGETWPNVGTTFRVEAAQPVPMIRAGGDWGMFQGGPERRGAADGALTPPLEPAWVHVNHGFGLSAPIVAGGRLFAAVANNTTPTEPFPAIVALNAQTGQALWTHRMEGRSIRGTPASDGRRVVYVADDGTLGAIEAETGTPIWTNDALISDLTRFQIFLGASPLVHDDVVFVGAHDLAVAVNLHDGATRWAQTADRVRRDILAPATLAGGRLAVMARELRMLDPRTGEVRWESDGFSRLNPVMGNRHLIVTARRPDRQWVLRALESDTGEPAWEQVLEDRLNYVYSAPAVGGGRVYFILQNMMTAYDEATGEIMWRRGVGNSDTAPVYVNGHVYRVSRGGTLTAYRADTGDPVWDHDLGGGWFTSGIAVSGNALYVTGRNGALYAFVAAER